MLIDGAEPRDIDRDKYGACEFRTGVILSTVEMLEQTQIHTLLIGF